MPLVVQTLALQFGRMSCLSSLDGYEVVADAVFISINTAFPVQTCIWCLGRRTCISVWDMKDMRERGNVGLAPIHTIKFTATAM